MLKKNEDVTMSGKKKREKRGGTKEKKLLFTNVNLQKGSKWFSLDLERTNLSYDLDPKCQTRKELSDLYLCIENDV